MRQQEAGFQIYPLFSVLFTPPDEAKHSFIFEALPRQGRFRTRVTWNRTQYQVLGLRKGGNDAEIKRSYIDLVKTYDNERHTARYMVIEAAYKKLADPTKRAIEDIFSYNYPTGLFRFTLEEQEPLSDPQINQMIQDAEGKLAQNRDNAELQASYIKALLMRAHKRCKKKLWAEAIEDWQRVLMVDPTHQRAKSNLLVAFGRLGCGFADSGLLEEAIDCWLKASQMNPDDDGCSTTWQSRPSSGKA